jgi:3-oxoacyl-[acyl-carrier protein] reductase
MTGKLDNKVAIVTGSGRGIGRAIACKLASEGAHVVVNDLDDGPGNETAQIINDAGGKAMAFNGDVAAPRFGEEIVSAAVDGLGGLDIIVNNAGYIWNTAIQNNSDEQFQAMLDIHAVAPFRILRAAYPYFRSTARQESEELGWPRCRKVVNISSISGVYGAATQGAYAAGKMAIVGLTNSLAKEWGRLNVTVNAVAFGLIETRLTQSFDGDPATIDVHGRQHKVGFPSEHADAIVQSIALKRPGQVDDGAGAVYLLCLPESDYITGQVLICDGGRL